MSIQIEQFTKAVKSASLGTYKSYIPSSQYIYVTERIVFSPVNDGCQMIESINYDGVFVHFIVNAKDLINRLKIVPKGSTITIRNIDGIVTITWSTGSFSIKIEDIDSFPGTFPDFTPSSVQEPGTIVCDFDIHEFNQSIKQTKSAMAYKDNRWYLNGLNLTLSAKGCKMISTNGHTLHVTPISTLNLSYGANTDPSKDIEIIIQRDVIEWITKTLPKIGTVNVQVEYRSNLSDKSIENSKYLVIKYGTTTIRLNSIDGKFPDWQRVLPSVNDRPLRIGVSPKQVIKALKNCSSFSDKKFKKVKLSVVHLINTNLLIVEPGNGSSYSEKIEVIADGEPFGQQGILEFSIGVNLDYLVDALSACPSDNDVMMCFRDDNSGLLIMDGEFQAVVMPIRL